jgi:7-carboxy-7-deazaguanine synthase
MLAVNEIFGPTFQGEGPSLGRQAIFLRLSGCNLHCVWCDTPYTWDWQGKNGQAYDKLAETHPMSIDEIVADLGARAKGPKTLLVISGGEPMVQYKELHDLTVGWGGDQIEVETNGTIKPADGSYWHHVNFNCSPKLLHAGNGYLGINMLALQWYVEQNAVFKFVVQTPMDFDEILSLQSTLGIENHRIWCMPEGRDPDTIREVTRLMAEEVLARGWNLTTRLHVQLWGDKRGR